MWGQTKVWDPEGIVSTLPAIATTLFGVLTGNLLRQGISSEKKAAFFLGIGAGLFASGQLANVWMPINKSLWTVSFSLLMAGLASIEFAILYWIIDIRGYKKWATPLVIYGTNAIVVFVLSGVLGRLLGLVKVTGADGHRGDLGNLIYRTVFVPLASPIDASLLYAIAFMTLFFLVSVALVLASLVCAAVAQPRRYRLDGAESPAAALEFLAASAFAVHSLDDWRSRSASSGESS